LQRAVFDQKQPPLRRHPAFRGNPPPPNIPGELSHPPSPGTPALQLVKEGYTVIMLPERPLYLPPQGCSTTLVRFLPVFQFFAVRGYVSTRFGRVPGSRRVRVKLSDACPFSPDVTRFHVFASRLAVFRRFRCNTVQRTRPRQVIRRLPTRRRSLLSRFHVFAHRLALFRRFRCNTGQRTRPRQVIRRFPVFTRRRPFQRFRPSLSRFRVFPLYQGAMYASASSYPTFAPVA
jgi:hypothetical protein